MTQINHPNYRFKILPPPVAAYTLNGEQPVICTIIGDEPLYYIDDLDPEAA